MSSYESLGIRPLINAYATVTKFGGSLMPPEVLAAMNGAAGSFVDLAELQRKVGQRLAQLTQNEAAYVTSGAAAGLMLSTAACVLRAHPDASDALPRIAELNSQAIIFSTQRNPYDFAIGQAGATLVEIEPTPAALRAAISESTAAVYWFAGALAEAGDITLPEVIAIGKSHDIPVIVDAAAQLPPRSHLTGLTTDVGADLAVFSGGKGLFGPQSSGLILGRADLVKAASMNSSPHSGVGRGMKVGKEEVAGLLRAVELFLEADEDQVVAEWERRCRVVTAAADGIDGVEAEYDPPFTNRFPPASPIARLRFGDRAPAGSGAVAEALERGEPSILVGVSGDSISVAPQTLREGEAEIIAGRLREILSARG